MKPHTEIKLFYCKTISDWNILYHADIIQHWTTTLIECKMLMVVLSAHTLENVMLYILLIKHAFLKMHRKFYFYSFDTGYDALMVTQ